MAVPARLDRVSRPPLSAVVFDQLLDRIVGGAFAPGQPLPPERQLCVELGVSRTAVREALARLAQLRLIQIRHGGETRVLDFRATAGLDVLPHLVRSRRLDAEVARSGFEMRAAIAPDVARLAAERRDEAALAALDGTLAAMAATSDVEVLQNLSLQFWLALTSASGNLAYQLALNTLRDAMLAMPGLASARANELRDLRGYRAIAEAVRKKDGAAAARAARAHLALGTPGITALRKKSS
jgi:DNA-binding FadR family transcriptional regulator